MNTSAHTLQFFSSDESYVRAVGRYLREGLAAGDTCVAVASAEHLLLLDEYLTAAGLDIGALAAEYRYIPLDAESTLATFFEARGSVDRQRFHRQFNQLMSQAGASGRPIRVFGEMVSLLVERGRPAAAILLEELWNELSREHNFNLFCVYRESEFTRNPQNRKLLHSCHSHVLAEGA